MILDGKSKSTTWMSLENRDMIRPDGVVSKNDNGARKMPNNSLRCIAVAAIKPPSHGTTSTINDDNAATNLICMCAQPNLRQNKSSLQCVVLQILVLLSIIRSNLSFFFILKVMKLFYEMCGLMLCRMHEVNLFMNVWSIHKIHNESQCCLWVDLIILRVNWNLFIEYTIENGKSIVFAEFPTFSVYILAYWKIYFAYTWHLLTATRNIHKTFNIRWLLI